MPIDYIPISDTRDRFLPPEEKHEFIRQHYPQGISLHGLHYLAPNDNPCKQNDYIIETIFELVRLGNYSAQPSRFQSAFASPDWDTALKWADLFSNCDREIWTIKLDSDPPIFDASFLSASADGMYSHVRAINNAHQYWSRACSNDPLLEALLPLPVHLSECVQRFSAQDKP